MRNVRNDDAELLQPLAHAQTLGMLGIIVTKTLKTALHRWWPKSVSQFWADTDGCVTQLSPDESTVRSPPGSLGGITKAHHVEFSDAP